MENDLIFDVGMHNGDDTAYYLSRGYRVVAIEANPELISAAKLRFTNAISTGRLRLYHRAICVKDGPIALWVNRVQSEHSSIDQDMASRFHKNLESVEVPGSRLAPILEQEGVPFYLKIDIEGADAICLQDLQSTELPAYVSAEAHSLAPLFELHRLGYRDFKCINQLHHNKPENGIAPSFGTRAAVREAWRYARADIARNLAWLPGKSRFRTWLKRQKRRASSPTGTHANGNGSSLPKFAPGASGPFGEDTVGKWETFEQTAYDWLHVHMGFPARSRLTRPGWYDFHAKRNI